MSRAPYQRMASNGNGPARPSSSSPRSGGGRDADAASEKHRQRHVEDQSDPQAPWLTHLEYSVDPITWDDDSKYQACPLCQSAFAPSLMGSGRHHCRMCGILCCGPCSRGSLDLPGYDDGSERVCEVCRKRVLGLRTFLNKNQEVLINNVHVNREAVRFLHYHNGNSPVDTEVWLSQSLLLLMYKDKDNQLEGVPVHLLESVQVGFNSKELFGRRTKTVMCCISSEDSEFAAKEPLLFSLFLADGRTLDFEAPSPALRAEWVDRLKSLILHTSQFVKYHFQTAQYKVHELIKKEKERLSPANIKRMLDAKKSVERAAKNQNSNKIREKYAAKKG